MRPHEIIHTPTANTRWSLRETRDNDLHFCLKTDYAAVHIYNCTHMSWNIQPFITAVFFWNHNPQCARKCPKLTKCCQNTISIYLVLNWFVGSHWLVRCCQIYYFNVFLLNWFVGSHWYKVILFSDEGLVQNIRQGCIQTKGNIVNGLID